MKKYFLRLLPVLFVLFLTACSGTSQKSSVIEATSPSATEKSTVKEVFTADDPYLGETSAPITMVVFADFQCPYCADFYTAIQGVEKSWISTGQLKVQYRDFPVSTHKNALAAHLAASAAQRQGKYWQMHDLLYQQQDQWAEEQDPSNIFKEMIISLGLNEQQFLKDLKNKDLEEEIFADRDAGRDAGVNGTPGFFINDQLFRGALTQAELEQELKFAEKNIK